MQKLRDLAGLNPLKEPFFLLIGGVLGFAIGFHRREALLAFLLPLAGLMGFASAKKGKRALLAFAAAAAIALVIGIIHLPEKEGFGTYVGFVREARDGYFLFESGGARYYVYEQNCVREPGDWLIISGYARPYAATAYESRFSFAEYLRTKGVSYALSPKKIDVRFAMPWRLRSCEKSFLAAFDPLAQGLIDSLLFGHVDETNEALSLSSGMGAAYFLSSSGLLLGGFLKGIEGLFALRFEKKTSRIIAFLCGVAALPFCLYKPGVWRIVLTRLFGFIGPKREGTALSQADKTSYAGLVLLFFERYNAVSTAFLYGFGLVYAHSLSQGWLLRFEKKKRKKISFFLHSLLIFPLIVDKGAIHLFAFAYSFLFLPMAYPFAFLSFASFLTLPFTRLLNGYAGLIRQIVGFLARFDVVLGIGPWGPAGIMAFYLFLGAALFFFDSGLAPLARRLVVLLIALLAINASPFTDALSQSVSFINVGQGDAILIRDGLTSVLIDTGGNLSFDMAEEVDIPFLRRERIRRLDCLILTHDDFDHSGAADSLRRRFPVSQCVGEASSFPLRVGRLIFVNHNIFGGDDDNEKSLVLGLAFMGKRWLFMGDAPLSIEAKMLETHEDLQADVLKVGHHGSKTSSGEQFLKAVSPAVAVISVGAKNPYGHPDPEVLSRLESLGITVRRTDQEGTIAFRRFGPYASGFSSA